MSEAHFSLKFHGPAFENGEIDVNDLRVLRVLL